MKSRRCGVWSVIAVVAVGVLASAAHASAVEYYVDRDVSDVSNNCLVATPCDQIAEALALADANDTSTDTVHVGRSAAAYGAVTVPDTPLTLLGGEFNAGIDGPASTIDGNAAAGVHFNPGGFPRTLNGFTVEGGDSAGIVCSVDNSGGTGTITVQQNLLDEPSSQLDGFVCLLGSHIVKDNMVEGSGQSFGIQVTSSVSAQITGNTVQGAQRSIDVEGTGMTGTQMLVEGNTIEVLGVSVSPAAGVFLLGATGDLRGNLITMDPTSTLSFTVGVYASNNDTNGTLRLARNRILGFTTPGGRAFDLVTPDPVTMESDLIAGNSAGIVANGNGTPDSVSLTNETLWGNASADVRLTNNPTESMTIDSSIVGDAGVVDTAGSTCGSAYSRGPVTTACAPFATNATPSFANPVSDFHLTPTGNAALIDMGSPAAPASTTDLGGNPRTIAIVACPARRDLGAYELATGQRDCTPASSAPPPPATTAPPTTSTKKCKRKKHRNASAAKKKHCKKKRR